jgi:hypothetical protein
MMIREVSIHSRRGQGGMVQVCGTGARAKEAVKILKKYKIEISGYTITGSRGERVYTYNVEPAIWPEVRAELEEIEERMQGNLF